MELRVHSIISLTLAVTLLCSCSESAELDYIARVGDVYLERSELKAHIPATVSSEDSSRRAKVYIHNWVQEQVVLAKAEMNLRDSEKQFEDKLEHYLNELKIFEYENQLVKQNLDTTVTDQRLQEYYDEHSETFKLRDHALRVRYASFDSDKQLSDLTKKLERFNERDSIDLVVFCSEHARDYYFRTADWIYLGDLLREMPIPMNTAQRKFNKGELIDFTQTGKRYLLYVEEYLEKEDVTPFEMEKNRIRNTIINQRKMNLLEEMRKNLFSEARNNGDIEIRSGK